MPPSNTSGAARRRQPTELVAWQVLTEHRHVLDGVHSFDQWSVELGKQLAKRTVTKIAMTAEPVLAHDSSTNALIRRYHRRRP